MGLLVGFYVFGANAQASVQVLNPMNSIELNSRNGITAREARDLVRGCFSRGEQSLLSITAKEFYGDDWFQWGAQDRPGIYQGDTATDWSGDPNMTHAFLSNAEHSQINLTRKIHVAEDRIIENAWLTVGGLKEQGLSFLHVMAPLPFIKVDKKSRRELDQYGYPILLSERLYSLSLVVPDAYLSSPSSLSAVALRDRDTGEILSTSVISLDVQALTDCLVREFR